MDEKKRTVGTIKLKSGEKLNFSNFAGIRKWIALASVENIAELFSKAGSLDKLDLLRYSGVAGRLDVVKMLAPCTPDFKTTPAVVLRAIYEKPRFKVLDYLLSVSDKNSDEIKSFLKTGIQNLFYALNPGCDAHTALPILKILLRHGAEINAPQSKLNAGASNIEVSFMTKAVQYDDFEIVKYLVEEGLNDANIFENSDLLIAASGNSAKSFKFLFELQIQKREKFDVFDGNFLNTLANRINFSLREKGYKEVFNYLKKFQFKEQEWALLSEKAMRKFPFDVFKETLPDNLQKTHPESIKRLISQASSFNKPEHLSLILSRQVKNSFARYASKLLENNAKQDPKNRFEPIVEGILKDYILRSQIKMLAVKKARKIKEIESSDIPVENYRKNPGFRL